MNSILCPVDFSETSINALEFAVRIGEKNRSQLEILYVFNEREFNKLLGEDLQNLTYKQLLSKAESRLDLLKQKIESDSISKGLSSVSYSVSLGKLVETVVSTADDNKHQMIVMGTDGVSNVQEALFGSNTIKVMEKSNCPVLCVPCNAVYNEFKRVVYATDYQEEDKLAIQQVVAFATPYDSRIHILHVSHNDEIIEKAVYADFMDELTSFIRYDKVGFDHEVVASDISRGIENYLNQKDSDLLVVLYKNRNFFDKIFHKSITRKLSYLTDHPLLAVKLS